MIPSPRPRLVVLGLVGEVLARYAVLPEPKRLIVLADHGFTGLVQEMDLNAWLRQHGLLNLDHAPANEWDCRHLGRRTRAFALDPGRIYLHTSDFARKGVQPDESERLREELRSELLTVTWQGNPVMQSVVRGREVYPGAAVPPAPDLLCVPRPGFSLRAKFDRTEIFGMAHRRGCHTADDAFFYDSAGAVPGRVRDVGGEVLEYFRFRRPLPKLPAALKPRDAPRAKDAAGVLPLV